MSELKTHWPEGFEYAGTEIEECSACGSADPSAYYCIADDMGGYLEAALCEVCYSTPAGRLSRPGQRPANAEMLRMVAQCTNLILRRIDEIEAKVKKAE